MIVETQDKLLGFDTYFSLAPEALFLLFRLSFPSCLVDPYRQNVSCGDFPGGQGLDQQTVYAEDAGSILVEELRSHKLLGS